MKLLIRFTLFVFVFSSEIFGCAGGYSETFTKDEYYNFLDQKMIKISPESNLYDLGANYPHNDRWGSFDTIKKNSNIAEWIRYLKLTPNEIKALFYGKDEYSNTTINQNAKPYISKLSSEMRVYIDFLDFQMKLANQDGESKLPANAQAVIDRALVLYNSTSDKFLKNRYAYLVMRLYHYTKNYNTELEFYTKNRAILESNWLIKEWVDALRAGAMQHLGHSLEANELYAQIFQNNKTNAHFGYYDFKITSDAHWQNQLARAKSSDDKARLYFLRAMKWENAPIYELESIAKIAPESIWFDRLSYMIMQSLQNQRYDIGAIANDRYRMGDLTEAKKSYEAQLAYYTKILSSIKNPSFFSLYSLTYLDALSHKPLDESRFAMLKSRADSSTMPYVNLAKYIYALNDFSSKDSASQDSFYTSNLKPLLATLPSEMQTSLLKFTALNMATLYPQNSIERVVAKDYANKYTTGIGYLLNSSDANLVESYQISKSRTFLDNKIFNSYEKDEYSDNNRLLSTLFMQKNDFAKAKIYAMKIKGRDILKLDYNPFNISLSGNNRKPTKGGYTLAKFIDTMSELQGKVKSGSATPMDHYLYANGLYNKSWFGNVPITQMYSRSIYSNVDDANKRAFDLTLAKKEYQSALKATNDKELQARISYQMLKIDLVDSMFMLAKKDKYKSYYHDSSNFDNTAKETLNINKSFRGNAKVYKSNFINTKYGKEIITQCATFKFI